MLMKNVGVVVIGRNEGERLKACINSLSKLDLKIVYVDSGSTDNSVGFVKEQGFDVVELDMSIPFSAGRARNEGYRFLLDQYDDLEFIQFVDGDCEICEGWLPSAYKHLQAHSGLASVCGRRKERYPDKTFYNKLCDIEWNTPVGLALATGGDFLCRKQALIDVNGFSPQVIAGEEPEMCYRMRMLGWQIERLDIEMTLHDADMTRFSQWWKRCERSGHAYAQGFFMHGSGEEQYYRKDLLRIFLWALFLPIIILCAGLVVNSWLFVLLFLYPLKVLQIFIKEKQRLGVLVSIVYSVSLVFGKFPQFKGIAAFFAKRMSGDDFRIIEYKS